MTTLSQTDQHAARQEQTAQVLREHIATELSKCGLKVCPTESKGARR